MWRRVWVSIFWLTPSTNSLKRVNRNTPFFRQGLKNQRPLVGDTAAGHDTGPPPAKRISIKTVIRQPEEILLPNLAAAHRVWTFPQVCPNTRNQFLKHNFSISGSP
jgi:hypothetical protein